MILKVDKVIPLCIYRERHFRDENIYLIKNYFLQVDEKFWI